MEDDIWNIRFDIKMSQAVQLNLKRACDIIILKKMFRIGGTKKSFHRKYLAYSFETKFIFIRLNCGKKNRKIENFTVVLMNTPLRF